MRKFVVGWIANTLAIFAVASIMGSIAVGSVGSAIAAGAILTVVNAIVRPVLLILTLPLTIVTLGIFYFFIAGFCLWLTAQVVPGFAVHGVFMTIVASVLISIISTVITGAIKD
jgi:putative membrane protein